MVLISMEVMVRSISLSSYVKIGRSILVKLNLAMIVFIFTSFFNIFCWNLIKMSCSNG